MIKVFRGILAEWKLKTTNKNKQQQNLFTLAIEIHIQQSLATNEI